MKLYTIGFTGKTAESFFIKLRNAGVKKIIDVRLWPNTQLAGFSKSTDLAFFSRVLLKATYEHRVDFAPTSALLKDYKDGRIDWAEYEKRYRSICQARHLTLSPDMDNACFLCAEDTPDHCHRRLLAQYLAQQGTNIEIIHL